MPPTDARFETFLTRLESSGERAALEYLSSLSSFRYVAVIFYAQGRGHAIHYFDRENPGVAEAEEFDQRATYCNTVITQRKPFLTADSMADERLRNHPARESVQAYYGVPILANDGTAQASLCYFDHFPRDTAEVDRELLLQAADVFRNRMAGYQLDRPASTVSTVRTETIGNMTLHVVERIKPGWEAPKYSIERSTRHADGSTTHRISYGRDGFASLEEALEFGREWCRAVSET